MKRLLTALGIVLGSLLLGGCPPLNRPGQVVETLDDGLKVRFPGREYAEARWYVYSGDHDEFRMESLVGGKKIIPAHEADLNVALWHQKEKRENPNSDCPETTLDAILYFDKNQEAFAALLVDVECKGLETIPPSELSLNTIGWNRLVKTLEEMKTRSH